MDKTTYLIGNSSSGIREDAFIGTPVVNVGSRQEGRGRGENVVDTDYNFTNIKAAIIKQIKHGKYKSDDLYGNGDAGKKITQILEKIQIKVQKKFIKQKMCSYNLNFKKM